MTHIAPQTTPRATAGDRQPLSRARILATALDFVDERGLAALSMRKLAAELGVEAMSLYNHIANKDDILAGVADLVFEDVEIPTHDCGDWTGCTRAVTHAARRALAGHGNVLPIIISGPNRGPAFLQMMDSVVGTLRGAGFDDDMAHHAWHTLVAHVLGFVLQRTATPMLSSIAGPGLPRGGAPAPLSELPRADFGHIVEIAPYLARCEPVDEFDFGLDVILTGLQAKLDAATATGGGAPPR